jgi:hypothetical protein
MLKQICRGAAGIILTAALIFTGVPVLPAHAVREAEATYVDTNLNTFMHDPDVTQTGTIGQSMQLIVKVGYNGVNGLYNPPTDEIHNVKVRLSQDQNLINTKGTEVQKPKNNPYSDDSEDESEQELSDAYNSGYKEGIERGYNASLGLTYPVDAGKYPLEVNASTMTQEKDLGTLKKGQYVEVSFDVMLRSDTDEGYYGIPVTITYDVPENKTGSYGSYKRAEFINMYAVKAGDVKDPVSAGKQSVFVIGENQDTPSVTAPGPLNFSVNFRNQSKQPVYDMLVHLETSFAEGASVQSIANAKSSASTQFPFEISKANYDQSFQGLESGATLAASYSLAVKHNAASAYYPLSFTVTWKDTEAATITRSETHTFYVRINNPAMNETESSVTQEFNANDREKARLVVSSYHTDPETVYAGQPFSLVMDIQNASKDINASNILLSLESEKASDSAVFATENGTNSVVIDSLPAGQTKEISFLMSAAAGVDPKSYSITINEKYDSPEFKNAEEKVSIDVPVLQVARLSVANFDVEPSSITVGNQADVMFGINNTGKVTLYNVTAIFEADSIQKTSAYVGNIKPGETGNVDAMLTGIQPTMDDGTIKVTISYEDVNGSVTTEEESVNLFVTEQMDMDYTDPSLDGGGDTGAETTKPPVLPIAGGVTAAVVVLIVVLRSLKKKKDLKKREQEKDEIL